MPPRPTTFSAGPAPNVAFSQFRLSGMYNALVCGLKAIARQLLNPAVLGHMSTSTPICGILPGTVGDLAGLRIHLHDVLVAEIGGADERAGRSIELPENSQLAHLEQRLASAGVDQDALEDFVHVLRLAGKVLVIPLHLSGVGIERERRVGVERVAVGAADGSGPRLWPAPCPNRRGSCPDRSCPRSTRRCRRGTSAAGRPTCRRPAHRDEQRLTCATVPFLWPHHVR